MELNNPALTFTLALAAGIIAQSAARHLRVPGIVLLLLVGVLLGPDVMNLVRPETLGHGLDILVGLSVAVILFEGGLNLSVTRLRQEARVLRLLVTVGALVTGAGAALAARVGMGWPWPIATTFGALAIVTGPTVITPLLRRIRVRASVSTILEAEGVIIDPIGAILAVVALELALTSSLGEAALGLLGIPTRLLLGATVGLVGGLLMAVLLRFHKLVPEGLENVFTLSLVLVLYEISDAIQPESGIMAAAVAGLVVGNVGGRVSRELREFKEELTVLLVGMLFVLLAADIRLVEVTALGWRGVAVVVALMFLIRPLGVAASTWGSGLEWRERSFIAWLGPRGIVAAAVASIFAERFLAAGYEVGTEFRALVFLVIGMTIVVQGFSSGPVASMLGIREPTNRGHIIVGANALGRALGEALGAMGEDVVLIDTNAAEARTAEEAGLSVIYGNANDEQVLLRAGVEGRRTFTSVTTNESANVLLARSTKEDYRVPEALAALEHGKAALTPRRAKKSRVEVLFGEPVDMHAWLRALRDGQAEVQYWRVQAGEEATEQPPPEPQREGVEFLPLALQRDGTAVPVGESHRFRAGDVVAFAVRAGADSPPAIPGGAWTRAPGNDPGRRAERDALSSPWQK
ncbi:MAG: sodium:proton antiporter [Gemmatimonadota bacterium]